MRTDPTFCRIAQVPRPTEPADFTAWVSHRNRPVHEDGLCHTCFYAARKARKRAGRAQRVQKRYGLSEEQHDALYARQGGRCPCGRRVTLLSPIDHDHASGAVRGILCDPTNRHIGYMGDAPQAALNYWAYLTRPPAQFGLITGHSFWTYPGLVQCAQLTEGQMCGRLGNEHG